MTRVELYSWVVTERGPHDDQHSLELAIQEFAPSAAIAWKNFLKLNKRRGECHGRAYWNRLGYVARRALIVAQFAQG